MWLCWKALNEWQVWLQVLCASAPWWGGRSLWGAWGITLEWSQSEEEGQSGAPPGSQSVEPECGARKWEHRDGNREQRSKGTQQEAELLAKLHV